MKATKAGFLFAFLQGMVIFTLGSALGYRNTYTRGHEIVLIAIGITWLVIGLVIANKYQLTKERAGVLASKGPLRGRQLLAYLLSMTAGVIVGTFVLIFLKW